MRKIIMTLAAAMVLTTGCAGKQDTSGLENSLAACESEKSALATKVGDLETENARLKEIADRAEALAKARKANLDDLRNKLKELIDAGNLTIEIRNGMIVLQLPNEILFDSGKASLRKGARETLVKVADALKTIRDRRMFVAGHTDNAPVKEKARSFKSNWELSTMRALTVHQLLTSAGLRNEYSAIAGFGDTDPVGDNSTDDGKAKNRRTEIMIMPDFSILIPELQAMANEKKAEDAAEDATTM